MEKSNNSLERDFVFVDEVYKIDNEYLIDNVVQENERDVAYRVALHQVLYGDCDVLLAGPFIEFSHPDSTQYNPSFDLFMEINGFRLLDYNNYEIVSKSYYEIKSKKRIEIDDELTFNFTSINKIPRLISILNVIHGANENAIVYRSRKVDAESVARRITEANIYEGHDSQRYRYFLDHLKDNFHSDWVVVKALEHGIGIHHGLVPKYVQKEIIHLFNSGVIHLLISTTTITEGVNTSAKNLIVLDHKKGDKVLKKFDAKNIAGRAGRFLHHYSGRVIVLKNDFMKAIEGQSDSIKHKNYDINAAKDDIDVFITESRFLRDEDLILKANVEAEQQARGIPDYIFDYFRVVSRMDKMIIYDGIVRMSPQNHDQIAALIQRLNISGAIDYAGFQNIIDIVAPIVRRPAMKFLMNNRSIGYDEVREYSTITHMVHFYLRDGYSGTLRYNLERLNNIDDAIRKTSQFVYDLLKYQLSKYLGVFNLMYKFYRTIGTNNSIEDVAGIDRLLVKLEYNAYTSRGRIASDFGVPNKVLSYYENPDRAESIRRTFDAYEREVFTSVQKVMRRE